MTDLERLDEALVWVNRDTPGLLGTHPHILTLAEFATAYRNLVANGERVERERDEPLLGLATTRELLDELRARIEVDGKLDYRTVDGDRLLVDPPKEEER